jgi:tight adherence protein B
MMSAVQQIVPVLVFVSVLLGMNALALIIGSRRSFRRQVSKRLSSISALDTSQKDLVRIRRGRSLSADGNYILPIISLNQLILQSGVTVGLFGILGTMLCLFTAAFLIVFALQGDHLLAGLAGVAAAVGIPVLFLKSLRAKRQRRFEEQLPDAIDILVRSLRAGHAIPIAINTVGKQMADPIGGEFSMTASELAYGLDLETAMANLHSRVGQIDLALLVLAVSIQSKMGGNLAEILANLSGVIRGRFKLRRKARALSAEGRFSAIVLSALPFVLFGVLSLIAPSFYGQVWNEPIVKPILGAALVWLAIGNVIMYRMVRFSV